MQNSAAVQKQRLLVQSNFEGSTSPKTMKVEKNEKQ